MVNLCIGTKMVSEKAKKITGTERFAGFVSVITKMVNYWGNATTRAESNMDLKDTMTGMAKNIPFPFRTAFFSTPKQST